MCTKPCRVAHAANHGPDRRTCSPCWRCARRADAIHRNGCLRKRERRCELSSYSCIKGLDRSNLTAMPCVSITSWAHASTVYGRCIVADSCSYLTPTGSHMSGCAAPSQLWYGFCCSLPLSVSPKIAQSTTSLETVSPALDLHTSRRKYGIGARIVRPVESPWSPINPRLLNRPGTTRRMSHDCTPTASASSCRSRARRSTSTVSSRTTSLLRRRS